MEIEILGDIKFTPDPTGHYGKPAGDILYGAGLIPYFIAEAAEETTVQGVCDVMMESYGFGVFGWDMMLEDYPNPVDDNLVLTLEPEDGKLYPLGIFTLTSGIDVILYPYALVMVTDSTKFKLTRMD
jgi:hypothetical protein